MEIELSQKQIDHISNLIKRQIPINDALMGKIKKYATPQQLVDFIKLTNEYGSAIELSNEDLQSIKKFKNQDLPYNEFRQNILSQYK